MNRVKRHARRLLGYLVVSLLVDTYHFTYYLGSGYGVDSTLVVLDGIVTSAKGSETSSSV